MLTMGSQHSTSMHRFPTPILQNPHGADFRQGSMLESRPSPSTQLDAESNPNGNAQNEFQHRDRGTLVVVNPGEGETVDLALDATQVRLDSIPFFNPIIIHKDKLGWSREGEMVRQRLDHESFSRIGIIVQSHLRGEGMVIAKRQNTISSRVKEVDLSLKHTVKSYMERQRAFAKHAESLNRITSFAHSLGRCQAVLNDCRRTAQLLNNLLPESERLEPFTWTEDTELVGLESGSGS